MAGLEDRDETHTHYSAKGNLPAKQNIALQPLPIFKRQRCFIVYSSRGRKGLIAGVKTRLFCGKIKWESEGFVDGLPFRYCSALAAEPYHTSSLSTEGGPIKDYCTFIHIYQPRHRRY